MKTSPSGTLTPQHIGLWTSQLIPITGEVRRRDGRRGGSCWPGGGAVATDRLMVASDVITSTHHNLPANEQRTTLDGAATVQTAGENTAMETARRTNWRERITHSRERNV